MTMQDEVRSYPHRVSHGHRPVHTPTTTRERERRAWISGVIVSLVHVAFGQGSFAHASEPRFEASPSSVALPDGPGSIQGMGEQYEVGTTDGSVSYVIPIAAPPGPAGIEPQLSLAYDSSAANGPLGVGWRFFSASVCRHTGAGVPSYDERDLFLLTTPFGGGTLIPSSDGWWVTHEESAFIRARQVGDAWHVQTPDGQTYRFGQSDLSREGPDSNRRLGTSCWLLDQIEDVHGHTVNLHYVSQHGRGLLTEIVYGPEHAQRGVHVHYEDRGDHHQDWRAGYDRAWTQRISRIETWASDSSGRRVLSTLDLTYQQAWNASRLTSVTLTGEDGTTMPTMSFDYHNFLDDKPSQWSMESVGASRVLTPGFRWIDIDGDALPDLVRVDRPGAWEWYPNLDGGGFGEPQPLDGAPSFDGTVADWIFADLDGDGRRDIVLRTDDGTLRWQRNLGDGDGEPSFDRLDEVGVSLPVALRDERLIVDDINGDGRIDFMYEVAGALWVVTSSTELSPTTGRREEALGWEPATSIAMMNPETSPSGVVGLAQVNLRADGVRFADFNGDGLTDLVRFLGTDTRIESIFVHTALGRGGYGEGRRMEHVPEPIQSARPEDVHIVDINRDGLADFVLHERDSVSYWLARGDGTFDEERSEDVGALGPRARIMMLDVNGNGTSDFVVMDPDADSWSVHDLVGTQPIGLLATADNGMGAIYRFSYEPLTSHLNAQDVAGGIPMPMHVLTSRVVSDGRDGIYRAFYHYGEPHWDRTSGQFRTFRWARVTTPGDEDAPTRITDHVFHTGGDNDHAAFGDTYDQLGDPLPNQIDTLAGRPRSTIIRREDGALMHGHYTRYEVRTTPDGRPWVVAAGELTRESDGGVAAPAQGDSWGAGDWPELTLRMGPDPDTPAERTLVVTRTFDAYGNVVSETDHGVVRGATERDDEARTDEYEWAINEDAWILGAMSATRRLNRDGEVVESRRYHYDGEDFVGLPLGSVARGNLTRTRVYFADEDRWIDVQRSAHDAHGNVVVSRDALGHEATFAYDDQIARYAIEEVRSLTHGAYAQHRASGDVETLRASATYDTARGVMISQTSFTGVTTTLQYDGLGRRVATRHADDSTRNPTTTYNYLFGAPFSYLEVTHQTDHVEERPYVSRTYVDGLGRAIATFSPYGDPDAPKWRSSGWTTYTESGELSRVYSPFIVEDIDVAITPPSDTPYTAYRYDELGRVVEETLEDGARARTSYAPGFVWSHDPVDANDTRDAGPSTRVAFDGLGRAVAVDAPHPSGTGHVRVAQDNYDARDLIVSSILMGGETRAWTYDSLGRATQVSDPDAGIHTRAYDDLGNVIARQNARGGLVMMTYDPLGRLVEVELQDADDDRPTSAARYAYDAPVDGMPSGFSEGRLVATYEPSFTTYIDRDLRGNEVRRIYRLDDELIEVGAAFDRVGRPTHTVYADGTALAMRYDASGNLIGAGDVLRGFRYDARGQLSELQLGNQLRQSWERDARGRVTRFRVGSGRLAEVVDLETTYDAVGLPTSRRDHVGADALSLSAGYTYDAHHRLVHANIGGLGDVAYQFDERNNLTGRTLIGEPVGGADASAFVDHPQYATGGPSISGLQAGPHTLTSAGDHAFGVDVDGQLTIDRRPDGDRTLRWDAAGRLTEIGMPDGTRVVHIYGTGWERRARRVYAPDGAMIEEGIYLDEAHELRWRRGSERELVKVVSTTSLGRIVEVRVSGFRGNDAGTTPLEVAPWIQASGAGLAILGGAHAGASSTTPTGAWRAGQLSLRGLWTAHDAPHTRIPVGVGALLFFALLGLMNARADRSRRPVVAQIAVRAGCAGLGGVALALVFAACAEQEDDGGTDTHPSLEALPDILSRGVAHYLHAPAMGTVVARTNQSGQTSMRSVSTPYGVITHLVDDSAHRAEQWFTGKEIDAITGYVYFGARWYAPELGRWLSPDPMPLWTPNAAWRDRNLFAYVGNSPTLLMDRFGFEGEPERRGGGVFGMVTNGTTLASSLSPDTVGALVGPGAQGGLVGATIVVDAINTVENTNYSNETTTGVVTARSGTFLGMAAVGLSNPVLGGTAAAGGIAAEVTGIPDLDVVNFAAHGAEMTVVAIAGSPAERWDAAQDVSQRTMLGKAAWDMVDVFHPPGAERNIVSQGVRDVSRKVAQAVTPQPRQTMTRGRARR